MIVTCCETLVLLCKRLSQCHWWKHSPKNLNFDGFCPCETFLHHDVWRRFALHIFFSALYNKRSKYSLHSSSWVGYHKPQLTNSTVLSCHKIVCRAHFFKKYHHWPSVFVKSVYIWFLLYVLRCLKIRAAVYLFFSQISCKWFCNLATVFWHLRAGCRCFVPL